MRLPIVLALFVIAEAMPASADVMSPTEYVSTAGASDLFEQDSSRLVLTTTSNANVKAFAQTMMKDHAASTAQVTTAAKQAGVAAAPARLTPLQTELLRELTTAKGPGRDALYIAQQKAAHGQALSVQQAYADEGSARPLKSAAGAIVPVVQRHISMLKKM